MRYLHMRYPPIGRATAAQTTAREAVRYVLPVRSNVILDTASIETMILSFSMVRLSFKLYKDYFR